jgi:hypothetical protein
MSALNYRENVEALKREVDELERLTSDEQSSMDHILGKAERALGAQRSVGTTSLAAKRTSLTSRQPERRPVPPAAPPAAHHQRPVPASGRAVVGAIDSGVDVRAAMSAALHAEGWSVAQVRAAMFATNGASMEATRGWLQSMPRSNAAVSLGTTAQQPHVHTAGELALKRRDVAGSALNAARSQRQPLLAHSQVPSVAPLNESPLRLGHPIVDPRLAHCAATPSSTTPARSVQSMSTIVALEPTRAAPSAHKVQAAITSEMTRATPAIGFDAFEAQTMTARGIPLSAACQSTPPHLSSSSSVPNVSIQIRDGRGMVHHLGGKLFHEHDTLKAVVMEYFRLFPQTPSPRIGCDVRLVVPWLQCSYSHEQLSTVTLRDASLCPTATVVLQVAKHV